MNGGYFQAYLEIDLSKTTKQTISGAYQLAKSAIKSGKPIILYGADYDGKKSSPIQVFGWLDGTTYIFSSSVLQVFIANDDGITVALNSAIPTE